MPNVRNNPIAPLPRSTTASLSYSVKAGDTMKGIAARAGVSVESLTAANLAKYPSLSNPLALQAGWSLTLPDGAKAPGPPPAKPQTPTGWVPKSNDQVMFVAVNNSYEHQSTAEADVMKKRGTDIRLIKDAKVNDTITTKDARGAVKTHDLTTSEGALSFALTLKLPAEQTQKIADVLYGASDDARDEMAQMAQMWAVAERGGQAPSRLVLSGHHTGSGVYGENNGKLTWPSMMALAEAMPRGARSVEDLLIAACYSGGQTSMERYQTMFPNLKTAVAYDGSSPGAASGATAHQKAWEKATRGGRDDIDRKIFGGMRKGENVTVWTKTHGFQDGKPPQSVDQLRENQQRGRADYDAALAGGPIASSQEGPVRDFYGATQRLIQHPETPAEERTQLEALRDQTIRLLYYAPVSKRFGDAYANKISQAFQALNLPVPDFKTLSRADALTAIKSFEDALAASPTPPEAASKFAATLQQFKQLDPALIPDTWV